MIMLSEDAQRTPLRESKKLLKEGYSVKGKLRESNSQLPSGQLACCSRIFFLLRRIITV